MPVRRRAASRLLVHLFGPPRMERDGRPVAPDTRKAIGMLAYLALTGQAQGRDRLAALLCPRPIRSEHAGHSAGRSRRCGVSWEAST